MIEDWRERLRQELANKYRPRFSGRQEEEKAAKEPEPELPPLLVGAESNAEIAKAPDAEAKKPLGKTRRESIKEFGAGLTAFAQRFARKEKGPEPQPAPEQPEAATEAEIKQAIAEEVKHAFAEQLEKANLSPEERKQFEQIANNKNLLDKLAEQVTGKLKYRKVFGVGADFLAGMAGGTLTRMALRRTLESVFAIGSGAAGGAIFGGAFRGFREFRKAAKEQYSAESWLKELQGRDNLELAKRHEALALAIERAKVKGDKEEALKLVLQMRDIQTQIGMSKSPESGIAQTIAEREEAMNTTDLTGEREKLYRELISGRRKKVLLKTAKGAALGAAIGALGGAVASAIGEHLREYALPEAKATTGIVSGAVKQEAIRKSNEAAEEMLRLGAAKLPEKTFTMIAQAGEGPTQAARNLIHDFLVQEQGLFGTTPLTREQLVYAEDYLQRKLGAAGEGGVFELKGQSIQDAVEKARALTGEKLQNLRENFVGNISEKTWAKITDYSTNFDQSNDVVETVKWAAKQRALEVYDNIMEQAAPQPVVAEAASQAAQDRAAAGPARGVERIVQDNFKRYRVIRNIVGLTLAAAELAAAGTLGYKLVKKIKERSAEKELKEQKLAADPVRQELAKHGLDPKTLNYGLVTREDLGKEKAESARFNDYSSYLAALKQFSPYERGRALKYPKTGILGARQLWRSRDKLPEGQKAVIREIITKAATGQLQDQFTGEPGIVPHTEEERAALKGQFGNEYNIDLYDDSSTDDEGNYYAGQKLAEALKDLPKDRVARKEFEPALQNHVDDRGIIHFNPDTPAEQLKEYLLRQVFTEAETKARINREAYLLNSELYQQGYNVRSTVSVEKYLRAMRALKEARLPSLFVPEKVPVYLLEPGQKLEAEAGAGIGIQVDLTPEEMSRRIQEYLESLPKETSHESA